MYSSKWIYAAVKSQTLITHCDLKYVTKSPVAAVAAKNTPGKVRRATDTPVSRLGEKRKETNSRRKMKTRLGKRGLENDKKGNRKW